MSQAAIAVHPTRRTCFILFCIALIATAIGAVQLHHHQGLPVPEWPLAVDLFLVLPLAYLLLMRPAMREALLGVLGLASLGIAFGAWVLPDSDKVFWPWLEQLRWVGVAAVVAWQVLALAQMARVVARSPHDVPLELSLHQALDDHFGPGVMTQLLKLEARVWLYVLCRARQRLAFPPHSAFWVYRQGGNASNQLGFLLIGVVEVPIVHVLLHLYNPTAALVLTSLTVYGLAFLFADYRATLLRPITVDAEHVQLRYGVVTDLQIPRAAILDACTVREHPRRAPGRLRCFGMGRVNTVLRLAEGTVLNTPFGSREITEIYLGLDEPERFIEAVQA